MGANPSGDRHKKRVKRQRREMRRLAAATEKKAKPNPPDVKRNPGKS